ncbi:MAG: 30S ribosomal protein S18 [Patescibacteria group bacterium]
MCKNNIEEVNWKDVETLHHFLTTQNKIAPRKYSHLCAKHQRRIARTIKRARIMSLLPFV